MSLRSYFKYSWELWIAVVLDRLYLTGKLLLQTKKKQGNVLLSINGGNYLFAILITLMCLLGCVSPIPPDSLPAVTTSDPKTFRIATFNVSLSALESGEMVRKLATGDAVQARKIAEIIQRVRPDVILINDFDYDQQGKGAKFFASKYLAVPQNGQQALDFPHIYSGPVNTGISSSRDLNKDGQFGGPADAFGMGDFPGQHGMVIYSVFPFDESRIRTFQNFLWKDIPDASLPVHPDTGRAYYDSEDLAVFRLSSKSHWDVPIQVYGQTFHLLASHPTSAGFDGDEDRNGHRNHDEIRFWADYISPYHSDYIYDDLNHSGGLANQAYFVVLGDLNVDPLDGDSRSYTIRQLIRHSLVKRSIVPKSQGGIDQTMRQGQVNLEHFGNPAHDTSDFSDDVIGNLRLDYVLPSENLTVFNAGVFWPGEEEEIDLLVEVSNHRLVWIDVEVPIE